MSTTAAQLIAKVSAEGVDKTKADLQGVGGTVTSVGGIFKSALGGPIALAASVAGKAFGFLKDQMGDAIKIAMQHQDVMAQVTAGLKSTHDASGMTAQGIDDLATSLSKVTAYSKDTIETGDSILLTFTGIGKKVFPEATQAMLDLSTRMGGDTSGAALQLGKALNDPVQGITALTRVGVTFSAQQKAQIKQMEAVGNAAGAQQIILDELNKEFGGSATAAGKTLSGALAILKNNFDDLKEKVGSAVIPLFSNFVQMINTSILPAVEDFFKALSKSAIVKQLETDFKDIGYVMQYAGYIGKKAFADIKDILFQVGEVLQPVRALFSGTGDTINGKFSDALGKAYPLIKSVGDSFHSLAITIEKDLSTVNLRPLVADFQEFMRGAQQTGSALLKEFGPAIQNVANLMKGEFMRELHDVGALIQQVAGWFMTSVVPALKQAEPGFANLAKTVLTTVVPAMIQIRGIVMDVVEHAFKTFGPIIERIVPPLIRFAGLLANDVANGLKFIMPYVLDAAKAIGQFADEIMDRVAPIITHWLDQTQSGIQAFSKVWNVIWPSVSGVLKGVWDEIVGTVKIAWSIVSGVIKIGLDLMGGNWKAAWNDLKDMLGGVWDGIKQVISGGLQIINNLFGGLPGQALQWGENLISSFIQGIRNMIGGVGQAASDVMDAVHNFIGVHSPTKLGPGRTLDQWGINLVKQFTNDIRSKTPEARMAAEDMMLQIQTAISGATTQLNMAKLSGNVAGQLAAKNTLFDLQAQMSQYQNVIKSSGYSYNAKDKSSPIGFGGQTMDQMVALAGVNKFTKDIASTTTGAHKDAQSLFSNLLKSLDGFAMKIAMAQLSGNTDLVNKLQAQQTTQQTQLSLFEMLAAKKGLSLDETKMNAPITSFAQTHNTAVAPSSVQYQFLGSRNQQTGPMVIQVQPNHIYFDGRILATALMPHMVNAIRSNTGVRI